MKSGDASAAGGGHAEAAGPVRPITFWREGLAILGRAAAYAVIAGGVSASQHLWSASSGVTLLITMAVGVGFALTFLIRACIAISRDKVRYQRDGLLIVSVLKVGGMLILSSAAAAAPGGLGLLVSALPVLLAMTLFSPGIMLVISGFPRRVGTQRVCRFCEYEYTFGYPPGNDLSAPPQCPECGKGWLGNLAVGVKRARPGRMLAGAVLVVTSLMLFGLPIIKVRAVNLLPARAQQALALSRHGAASAAWDALQPALAAYTPQQHMALFTALLDKRLERPWSVGPSEHAYLLQQLPAMPAALQERFHRELAEIRVYERASPDSGRMHIAIASRHLGSANAECLVRVVRVTAGDVPQTFALEEAWPGLQDASHYFSPVSQRNAEELVISTPTTDAAVVVRLRLAVIQAFVRVGELQTADPPTATWVKEFDFPVERRE